MDKVAASVGLSLSQTHLSQSHLEAPILEQEPTDADAPNPLLMATATTMPRLMLLTVAAPPKRPCEQRVGLDDFSPLDSWLTMDDGSLDGVYLQFEKNMMTEEGAAALRELSQRFAIGIWTYSGIDPDDYETFEWLVRKCNCTYVNTDIPNHFRREVSVRRSSTSSSGS